MISRRDTSWNKSGTWYNKLVGNKGHYYHEHVVLPNIIRLLTLSPDSALLDIGCGQGILAKHIPQSVRYTGIDLAENLIAQAKKVDQNPKHHYILADATKLLPIDETNFSHATAVLSLQNMEAAENAIQQVSAHLLPGGKFLMVLNHPAFRIPRQSGWGIGENKLQYRYINRYMSALKIPILMHPGEKHSEQTWSFHQPISYYTHALQESGFAIQSIEEWTSDKESVGRAAKMENRARSEIPLFMAILAMKQ